MPEFATEQDLARARSVAAFRQQLLQDNLEWLLDALKKMRRTDDPSPESGRQMREGVDFAVQLADRLQQAAQDRGPQVA